MPTRRPQRLARATCATTSGREPHQHDVDYDGRATLVVSVDPTFVDYDGDGHCSIPPSAGGCDDCPYAPIGPDDADGDGIGDVCDDCRRSRTPSGGYDTTSATRATHAPPTKSIRSGRVLQQSHLVSCRLRRRPYDTNPDQSTPTRWARRRLHSCPFDANPTNGT
jgi:hypothetical protein